jgi:hypothetical protein
VTFPQIDYFIGIQFPATCIDGDEEFIVPAFPVIPPFFVRYDFFTTGNLFFPPFVNTKNILGRSNP